MDGSRLPTERLTVGEEMNEAVRDLLWDINFAVNGQPMVKPVGPTSYTTYHVTEARPDRFLVYRNGEWFEVSARILADEENP